MAKKEITTDVTRMIDEGEMDAVKANQVLNILKAYKEQLAASEKRLREYIVDKTDPNQTMESVFGVSTHSRGSESKPRVKDRLRLGSWLFDNGEENLTVHDVVIPVESIMKPDALQALIERHDGVIPDGVEYSTVRGDSVVVKPAMSWDEMMADPTLAVQAMKALKISVKQPIDGSAKPQVTESKDSEEDNRRVAAIWAAN